MKKVYDPFFISVVVLVLISSLAGIFAYYLDKISDKEIKNERLA